MCSGPIVDGLAADRGYTPIPRHTSRQQIQGHHMLGIGSEDGPRTTDRQRERLPIPQQTP